MLERLGLLEIDLPSVGALNKGAVLMRVPVVADHHLTRKFFRVIGIFRMCAAVTYPCDPSDCLPSGTVEVLAYAVDDWHKVF